MKENREKGQSPKETDLRRDSGTEGGGGEEGTQRKRNHLHEL